MILTESLGRKPETTGFEGLRNMYIVYKHTCPNGKVYIGITSKNPKIRWACKYKTNKRFYSAIQKYGWENIIHEILFKNLTKEEAEAKKIELIAFYKSNDIKYGYNISKGGHSNYGYHHSKETKNKIRNSLIGQKHTTERIQNQRLAQIKLWSNPEYKLRMSEAHKGKQSGKNNPSSKVVYQYSFQKELIRMYESVGTAERITGIAHQQISACCNKRQKSCHGYIWSYELL